MSEKNVNVAGALELYLQAKSGAQALAPFNPFATVPFSAADAFSRMLGGVMPGWGGRPPQPAPAAPQQNPDDVARLRRELDELKQSLRKRPKKR